MTFLFVGLCGSANALPDVTASMLPEPSRNMAITLDHLLRPSENATPWIRSEDVAFCSGGSSICCKLGNSRTTCVYDDGQCMGIGGTSVGGGAC